MHWDLTKPMLKTCTANKYFCWNRASFCLTLQLQTRSLVSVFRIWLGGAFCKDFILCLYCRFLVSLSSVYIHTSLHIYWAVATIWDSSILKVLGKKKQHICKLFNNIFQDLFFYYYLFNCTYLCTDTQHHINCSVNWSKV